MFNMNTNKDSIMSTMEEFGLTMDDVIVLMKGYEKFTESSANEKKKLMNSIKSVIENQQSVCERYKSEKVAVYRAQRTLHLFVKHCMQRTACCLCVVLK